MTEPKEGLSQLLPNTDHATLDLANAWPGTSYYNIHEITVDVRGQQRVYRDSVLRSYAGIDAADSPRYWLDEILHGNWPGTLTSSFALLEQDIDGLAAGIGRISGEKPIQGAEMVIKNLRGRVHSRRQAYVSEHITMLRSFVDAPPEDMVLWACHLPSIGESLPTPQGKIESRLFRVAAVEVSTDTEGEQTPQVIYDDKEGNRGIYPGGLSLYIGRPSLEPVIVFDA